MGSIDISPLRHIGKVLIANRGEIAVRCIKACRELGVRSVAIITNADATSLHATLADEVVLLPGEDNTAYTNGEAILEICKQTNADAIIPGYGFLSENVEFANAVSSAGIIFVGPSSASINAMGLKHEARAIAQAANVPVIPGTQLLASAEAAIEATKRLGCPVMLKATGGGGGMGLQICHSEEEVQKAFAMVESRASTLFKNSGVFLEKYYPNSRHIEVQVAGNGEIVVAFGERECSLQRRHQKVIEECPSPFVERHPGLREKMLQAAVNYASQLKYKSVGTVEFLVDDETADFFFLEMNTRLQVEHGITELCYGVDLVHLMLRQADCERGGQIGIPSDILKKLGRPKPLGSAIEARVYAEVPLRDFAPSPGILQHVHWPKGEGVRIDTWVRNGQKITPFYDPLIGKVMAYSPDGRAAAQKKMLAVLAETALQGTQSNLEYLSKIVESEIFTTGNTLTNSLSMFKFESCSLQVLEPGVYTTIQDYPGRVTVSHGIPPGGPMDDFSARVANILVDNDLGVELLELTLSGPKLLFHEAAVVAVCGAELPIALDGVSQPMWSRIIVGKSQTLELGKVTGNGLRTYLAVKGGFPQVPNFLGSKSTAPELGFGGVQGRKLQIHDILTLSPQSRSWASEATPLSLPPNLVPSFATSVTVCCIDGPYGSEDILTPEGRTTLYEAHWTVKGPRLKWARASGGGGGSHPSNVLDYGYPNGGVNFTGEFPIIFGPDRPDLGGFMWKIGQLKPGNTISRKKDEFFSALAALSRGRTSPISPLLIEFADEIPSSILHLKQAQGNHPRVTYRQGGDTSIIIEYGDQVSDLRNTACVDVRGDPNFTSLTVRFDPFQVDRSKLLQQLIQFDDQIGQTVGIKIPVRQIRLPRYMENIRPTAAYLPDNVEYLRKNNALETHQQVFDALLKTPWLAVAVGFYVGTPILFPLDPWRVLTGQKYNPTRVHTPSGTVGLGGSLVAIYPVASPGGYQMYARTLGGWDPSGNRPGFSAERPWLFKHLDLIKFYEVSEEEYNKIEQDFETGRYTFDITQTTLHMDEYIEKFETAAQDPAYQAWRKRQAAAAKEVGEHEQRLFDEWMASKNAEKNSTAAEGDDIDPDKVVSIESPINANVWKVLVKPGDVLEKGQTVAVLEAMKMEINLIVDESQAGATVKKISQPPGNVVTPGLTVVDGASIPQDTVNRGQEADPSSKISYQLSSTEQAVTSPSFSNSSHGHSPSISYTRSYESGPPFVFDGVSPELLQFCEFDFIANEPDMISGYLMDVLPLMDYQQPTIEDMSDSYNGAQSFFDAPDPHGLEISSLMQTETTPPRSRAPAGQSIPNQPEQTRDSIDRSLDAIEDLVATNPWTVSAVAYEKLTAEVAKHMDVLPEPFTLPSRQTLSRYVASWMRGFHPHLLFIHIPTTRLELKTPMLVMTLAATGAFYGFEHTHGYAMYFLVKSIITHKLEKRRRASTLHLLRSFPRYAGLPNGSPNATAPSVATPPLTTSNPIDIELLQSLLVLVLTMAWLDGPLAQDALAMSSQLTELTREAVKSPTPETPADNWRAWALEEERRRTLYSAYFVINILTICFNVPPQITSSEITLPLPSSEAEFEAPSSSAWLSLRQKSNARQPDFQPCLQQLLSGKPLAKEDSATEFGNYMLVQSLLMQVFFEHQVAPAVLNSSSSLSSATISLYENAYSAWQSCWDSAIESALDPSSPHGPLAFNSTAMLRLAHVHLAVGLQSQCALRSRDPKIVAQAFEPHHNLIPLRSPHLDQAVFHAICALRIPVRVGIAFVARGRTGHWSVQHAISNFACALLLTHWLENLFHLVSSDGIESLRYEEKRLLSIVDRLIEETHLESSLGPKDDYPRRIRRLAIAAVRLWAETCKGIQVFEIVHVVGETLSLVAESLENRF
ncbi:hypothetical protein V8C35DRAFT_324191 [Trichoderma chlorosporum]